MILLDTIIHSAIEPAMALLPSMDSREARALMIAIGLQESRFMYRHQKLIGLPYQKGPARGFWQFERSGIHGVMVHSCSNKLSESVAKARAVPFDSVLIHAALEHDDVLAAAFARLLLWTDLKPLPALNATSEEAWRYYSRNWRPGKPHRETWDHFHDQALAQILTPEERSVL